MLMCRTLYVFRRIRYAQNSQKTIKNIVSTLTEDKKGFQKIVNTFRFITNNYATDLTNTLSSLDFAKTKLALLSSEKLPTLIYSV